MQCYNTFWKDLLLLLQISAMFVIGNNETVIEDPCSMCESSDATISNPGLVIPLLGEAGSSATNQPTCQQVYEFAKNVSASDFETCSLIQGQAPYCGCPESSTQPINACSLCPLGPDSMPGTPDYVIPPYGDDALTCGELQTYISYMPETECNKFDRSQLLFNHNFICQCPEPEVRCSLCPDGTVDMDNPDAVIPYFELPTNEKPTCAEARDFVSIQGDDIATGTCKLYHFHAGYCGCPTFRSGDPVEPLNKCSLCPDASDPAKLDYVTPSNDTCADLQSYMTFLDDDGCDSTTAGLIQANAFVCGCPGVEEPNCDLCIGESEMVDPNMPAEEGNLTCGELELVVTTLPDNLCEARDSVIQLGRNVCCKSDGAGISIGGVTSLSLLLLTTISLFDYGTAIIGV